jgi:MFS family permease
MGERRGISATLHLLLHSQFGIFLGGNGLSLIGSWMQRIACSWLIWDWTGSAFWLGILAAGDMLPVVVIGPFAGVAADRWDRRKQNMLAQIISACLAILMAVLLALGHLGLYGLVILVTLQGTLTAAIQPARLAMVQQMVPREEMASAVALNSVNVNLARLLGPAVAGVMILRFDIVWIFVANAAVTFLFVLVLARLRLTPQQGRGTSRSFLRDMNEGFVYILHSPPLRLILFAMLCGGACVRAILELIPAIAAGIYGGGTATGLALLTGAAAVGAVVSGLTMGRTRPERLFYGVLFWWSLGAIASAALSQTSLSVLAMLAAAVLGASITRGLISTQTFVQLTTPDRLRGRVLSVHGLIARGSPALGALMIGYAVDQVGLGAVITISSMLLLAAMLALVPVARRAAGLIHEAA